MLHSLALLAILIRSVVSVRKLAGVTSESLAQSLHYVKNFSAKKSFPHADGLLKKTNVSALMSQWIVKRQTPKSFLPYRR